MTAQDTITAFLRSHGLTPAQIAGVEGNLQIESGFSSTASNPREGAIGIAQWEGGRRTALQAYARTAGGAETDLNTQLGFLWQELQTTERGAFTALQAATTPADAAAAFDAKYERSSGAARSARINAANAIAGGATFTGGSTGGAGTPTAAPAGLTLGGALPGWLNSIAGAVVPGYGLAAGADATAGGGVLGGMFAQIGTWLVDALLILMGAGLVLLALYLVAKGGESVSSSSSSSPTVVAGGGRARGGASKTGAVGKAEEAGETAAVAA